jgi:elongation factor P--beta-lysine ligase
MPCKHDRHKCINNRFFCLICGVEIADPFAVKEDTDRVEEPAEAPKKARKRKAKKEGGQ